MRVLVVDDEPALRELLPLRKAEQQAYLDWSVRSFRIGCMILLYWLQRRNDPDIRRDRPARFP